MKLLTRDDLQTWMEADKRALSTGGFRAWITNDVWRVERRLRILEFHTNNGHFVRRIIAAIRYRTASRNLGILIPPNVFGPGFSISHPGPIIVNSAARVGPNCRIHPCVVIGTKAGLGSKNMVPRIGQNCYIGPGAKISGPIHIGDNVAIGANAVIDFDIPDNSTVVSERARIVSSKGSTDKLIEAFH